MKFTAWQATHMYIANIRATTKFQKLKSSHEGGEQHKYDELMTG